MKFEGQLLNIPIAASLRKPVRYSG